MDLKMVISEFGTGPGVNVAAGLLHEFIDSIWLREQDIPHEQHVFQ